MYKHYRAFELLVVQNGSKQLLAKSLISYVIARTNVNLGAMENSKTALMSIF